MITNQEKENIQNIMQTIANAILESLEEDEE